MPSNALIPLGAIIHVSFRQLQHGPCPARAAVAGPVPQDVLSCSMPPGTGFPHPTQTACARSPGLSLSLRWSPTGTHRDMVPPQATPKDWPNLSCHTRGCLQSAQSLFLRFTQCLHTVPAGCGMPALHLQPKAPACGTLFSPLPSGAPEARKIFIPSSLQPVLWPSTQNDQESMTLL